MPAGQRPHTQTHDHPLTVVHCPGFVSIRAAGFVVDDKGIGYQDVGEEVDWGEDVYGSGDDEEGEGGNGKGGAKGKGAKGGKGAGKDAKGA